jgi:hypothetical protein
VHTITLQISDDLHRNLQKAAIDTGHTYAEIATMCLRVGVKLKVQAKERSKKLCDLKRSKGVFHGRPPYGYKFKDGQLVVDPEKALRVRRIYTLRALGLGYSKIAKELNLPRSLVRCVISNELVYRGYMHDGRRGRHLPIL